jgi:LysR family cyn operon transcriptional activator
MIVRPARYFLAVVEHGSFTHAAAKLNVSQPALSQQVRQLEDRLGVTLLDRSGKKLRLTDAGRTYMLHLKAAFQNLDAAQRAVRDVENLSAGFLRVAFLPLFTTYLLEPAVKEFRKRHPAIDLRVDILAQAAMETALAGDRYDIGIGLGDLASAEVMTEPLHEEQLCLIVGNNHPLAGRKKISATDLGDIDFALLDSSFVTRAPIDSYLKANNVRPRMALESNSVDALIAIVQGSRLATIFPAATARNLPGLRAIGLNPPFAVLTTSILLRRDGYRSAAAKAFLNVLKKRNWTTARDR